MQLMKQYLQFMFGLLNRLITDDELHFDHRPINYVPLILDIWKIDTGNQDMQVLLELQQRGKAAYMNWCQRKNSETLEAILNKEYEFYQEGQQQITVLQYQRLVIYNAFWEFMVMTLAMLLKNGLEKEDLYLLHDQLFDTPLERQQFHHVADCQRQAMGLSVDLLVDLLLEAGNMDPGKRILDKHKIAIITCVNDEKAYQRAILSWLQLQVPDGMKLELVPVRGAVSMCSGYNEGMHSSDAKYKLYLHQDIILMKENILAILIRHFKQCPQTGMIGLAGSRYWRENAIWWEEEARYMHVIHRGGTINKEHQYDVGKIQTKWQCMSMLDGLFLMTQYDIPWREDILHGWHFYDIAQCAEFQRLRYVIEVPKQEESWCIHFCGDKDVDSNYHYWRQVFLYHYRKELEEWKMQ